MTTNLIHMVRLMLALSLVAFCGYTAISVWATRRWFKSRKPFDLDWTPGVTILKPVRGIETPHVFENFVTFCEQDYPNDRLQIVFGCLESDDPVIPIIEQVQREHPHVRIDLVTSGPEAVIGPNRKVCNLLAMMPVALYDILVLCDSDMRVDADYVRRVIAPFHPDAKSAMKAANRGAGLVTCPYRGYRPESPSAIMEALGIGTDFIPSALVSRSLEGVGFAFGSTIAIPRSVLEEIGGFGAILSELADDYRMGEAVRSAGYEVVLSDYVVDDVLGPEKFIHMWNRRLRWARTVRACRPGGYAGLFVTFGTPLSLMFWAVMGFNSTGSAALAAILGVRLIATSIIAGSTGDRSVRRYLPLLPVSDVLSFGLYLASFCGNRIVWRGETFRLLPGGKMVKQE